MSKSKKIVYLRNILQETIRWRFPLVVSHYLHKASFRLYLTAQRGTYQPVISNRKVLFGDLRETEKRWEAISRHLTAEDKSCIDLGCSEGFFTFKMADFGLLSVGVDNLPTVLSVARHQCILENRKNVAFVLSDINHDFINRLPQFDVVVFLSVLHHMMYMNGVEWCATLLRLLRQKTSRVMFFEMGQSNERLHSWHSKLPDMGDDPHAWIADFLCRQGFSSVQKIGMFSPDIRIYPTGVKRALFIAKV